MNIAYTSDIHVDASERNREACRALAGAVRALRPDVFVLAGDAGNTLADLVEALSAFDDLAAAKLFVAGNHDVWVETRGNDMLDSRAKLEEWIPTVCRTHGFHDLGREPVVIGDVGFVGSLGWYDYTFADPRLGLGKEDYWRGRHGDDIWWDKRKTFWPPPFDRAARAKAPASGVRGASTADRMRDGEICAEMAERLEAHIASVENRAARIVAVIHTLPFFEGIPRSEPPRYLDAFTGSERLGRVLEAHPRVRFCIHGHKHTNGEWTVDGIRLCRRVLGRLEEDDDAREEVARAVGTIEV